MTVASLIRRLEQVPDKDMPVYAYDNEGNLKEARVFCTNINIDHVWDTASMDEFNSITITS